MSDTISATALQRAKSLAVVVIDIQRGPFESDPQPFDAAAVIERINSVTAKARAAGIPVIFIAHEGPPDPGWRTPDGWDLHPDLQIAPGEIIIRKTTADAFLGTKLEEMLRGSGIESLLLMGYATDFCLDATVRNAASKGFEIFIVADAHTTNDTPELKAPLIQRHFNLIWPDSFTNRPVHVLPAVQVRFGTKNKAAPPGAA